ncbi:MAG: hypothetical protein WC878_06470 [Candidatus Paceibacterota bacterium]|jgi:hypothetical protein
MLDPKEEELLTETYKIEKENNKMLHTIYNNMWWGRIFRIFYWTVILLLMIGSYYYAQPYIESLLNTYNSVSGMISGLKP